MAAYTFDGQCLKSRFGNLIGEIEGNIIKDARYNKIAEVDNGEIKDAHYKKIWTTEGVRQIIDGPEELSSAALWVLLLR